SRPPHHITTLLLVLAFLALGRPAEARGRKEKADDDKDKPRLSLVADPNCGFTPATGPLPGQLPAPDLHAGTFCHPPVARPRIDPGQTERDGLRVREDPACVHPDEEISVTETYTRRFDLYRPGSYLIRLELQGKDGKKVISAYTRVEVLRVQ